MLFHMTSTTARQHIEQTATANGWVAADQDRTGAWVAYTKGRRRVSVNYTITGTVSLASTERRRIEGTGKAQQVLDTLAAS